MKIILSRKGFDSSSGGVPSPIFPDGSMISLPIPDRGSTTRYEDMEWQWGGHSLGHIVRSLTRGKIKPEDDAHLDPDLQPGMVKRAAGWKPLFGQVRGPQRHLQNQNVSPGDIFVFFGLFRRVEVTDNEYRFIRDEPSRHVIWGWMKIGEIVPADKAKKEIEWTRYHSHCQSDGIPLNTLYISADRLDLNQIAHDKFPASGVFSTFHQDLQLTQKGSARCSVWELPKSFYPSKPRRPLTYHENLERWTLNDRSSTLKSVSRGQEFVLDANDYPESIDWFLSLLEKSV